MSEELERIMAFAEYASKLEGDEKGEAQVFCDRLFQGFGHAGYKEAGATLEYRVKRKGQATKFADLLWRPRLLLEMKKRGEPLQKHYRQAFEYWIGLVPDRPRFVVLCNFDEFWIYDFNTQLDEPVDRVLLEELPDRYTAFNFLFPVEREPQFGNDRVAVTRAAADKVAQVFNSLVERGEDRQQAQRFMLQCVVAMFSEDFDLLPKGLFTELLEECSNGQSTYDLLGGLFRQMDSKNPAKAGRYQNVQYFNGGLFETVEALELNAGEIAFLRQAAAENWGKVAPPIFGTLFQSSMDKGQRHAFGAHFTSEADIQKIVLPTIVRPWRERINKASALKELLQLSRDLLEVRVLDPACGSGNFLYIAYRELVNLEMEILAKIHDKFGERARKAVGTASLVSTKQVYGIDKDSFAVELAKVTVMLGKRIALAETHDNWFAARSELPFNFEDPLPLDNLDENIREDDALFCEWPDADFIIGNPPYQSKNKMLEEYGRQYVDSVRARFPDVPGRADYCVYWFRKAHDELTNNERAGLVGTNTIRQNYSREGGLDYIVNNGGTITEAVSTQVWSGDAVIHVSIVNWLKGDQKGRKKLFRQVGDNLDSPWEVIETDRISSSLSFEFDVTQAASLSVNAKSDACYQGQTHGHEGFLLTPDEARYICADKSSSDTVHPYLTGDELLSEGRPLRFVIDLNHCGTINAAMRHKRAFERLKQLVLPDIQAKSDAERKNSGRDTGPRQSHAKRWWKFWRGRGELLSCIARLPRYIACCQVTKRPIFVFVEPSIHPNAALIAFPMADDYSFGILQSDTHWLWFKARCSTLKGDYRYTSNSVFDSFPWPQKPTKGQVRKVADAAKQLRACRNKLLRQADTNLRELYRSMEVPGTNLLRDAHVRLNNAVRSAYGMGAKADELKFLFLLNQELADNEGSMKPVIGPGLPPNVKNPAEFVSDDCIRMP